MIGERALKFVKERNVVGLGSGRTASKFIEALGARCREGFRIQAVPTSEATAKLAAGLGIPLITFEEAGTLHITVDGADEVDRDLNLIKGYGGALVREKIVAAASGRLVILVESEKLVTELGARGKLPVEVVPFGLSLCRQKLEELGFPSTVREVDGLPFVSDNGNHILDCAVRKIRHPQEIERLFCSIPGIVGTGLFLNMADTVLIQNGNEIEVRER